MRHYPLNNKNKYQISERTYSIVINNQNIKKKNKLLSVFFIKNKKINLAKNLFSYKGEHLFFFTQTGSFYNSMGFKTHVRVRWGLDKNHKILVYRQTKLIINLVHTTHL